MAFPFDWLRSALDPDRFHGSNGERPFFEGWYYKLVDASATHRFAIIPGISRGAESTHDHAFIQLLDGVTGQDEYIEYPVERFASSPWRFDISVGPNRFTRDSISIDIDRPGFRARGKLAFWDTVPWPVSLRSPGIMGWYAWVPFMECYHGVVSLDHQIDGKLEIFGETIDFSAGRGYSEKDWGRAFPDAYVWFQSNHFETAGTSLVASLAIIPWLRGAFPGYIVGLWHGGRLYRFATYTGARIERLEIGDREILWSLCDRRFRLTMRLERSTGGSLRAPTTISMDRRIVESLGATGEARLEEVGRSREVIFEGTGRHGGMEAAGDLPRLVDLYRNSRRV